MKPPVLLRVYLNDKLEGVRQFDKKQIVIGRNAESQLQLNDDSVSPLHAFIEERDSGYYLADLGSTSGTYRNGQKTLDDKLESGDEIKVGSYKIQFFIGVPKPAGPPQKTSAKAPPEPVEVKPPPAKSEPVKAATAKSRPSIPMAPTHGAKKHKKKGGKTFAPASPIRDPRDIVRPGKGTVIEVIVAWKERIIAARHFNDKGTVTIGSSPDCDLVVPIFGAAKFPLVKIQNLATISISQDMAGELVRDQGSVTFAELFKQNKMRPNGGLYDLDIPQGEMARIGFQGDLLSVFVRYVAETPKPLVAPLLDLTASEVTGVILAFVVSAIFGLYMMIYSPTELPDEARLEEPLRKAVVTFNAPKKVVIEQVEEKPTEKKVVQIVEKQKQTQTPTAANDGKQGVAGEVAPKKPTKEPPKLTSTRQGGATKTAPTEGSTPKAQKPDPSKMGLLNVFGSKGTQSKLDKTFSGAGDLTGMANSATGFAGNADSRAGDNIGAKLKDTGPGGKGTATVGISGVGTQSGKGAGTYGTGTGGIGNKGSVNIDVGGQEAEFTGSIDKEAIRRIIQQNKNAIRSCYERSLQRHPDLYGKLVLEWDIEERGKVTRTAVKSNNLGDSEVANCIMGRIKDLKFPEPPPDQIGRVTFPFVFSSQ